MVHAHRLLGWRVNLKLVVVRLHRKIDTGLPLHSVHHLRDVGRIYVVEFLLVLLLVFTVEVFRYSEVCNLGCAARAYKHVARFQITMQLVFLKMQEHQAIQNLVDQARYYVLGNQGDP